jgi:hypothetical protein
MELGFGLMQKNASSKDHFLSKVASLSGWALHNSLAIYLQGNLPEVFLLY